MRRTPALVAAVVGALVIAFGAHAAGAYSFGSDQPAHPASLPQTLLAPVSGLLHALAGTAPACADVPAPRAHCLARYQLDENAATARQGWRAADIAAAYRLPVWRDPHQTIGITIAYDTPTLERDLATYRAANGLPPCTTANGCFRKVDQDGHAAPLPAPSSAWGIESSLDVQMASAACPRCHILVVESRSDSIENLGAAVDTAVRLGADVVSNSYGVDEYASMDRVSSHFRHPGHAIVASSGDTGYSRGLFPAVDSAVTAVGGTTLRHGSGPRGWAESAWGGATSACSSYVAKPAWQQDEACANRTVADVSAVASNLSVYDSYGQNGWMQIDGTSAAAPIIAGAIALSGGAHTFTPARLAGRKADLFDVRGGANDTTGTGAACGHDYRCMALAGYDAPTGWGTPDGARAFAP